MPVKSKSGIDFKRFHNGKAGAIRITEILDFIFQENGPGFFFFSEGYRNQADKTAVF
jgi:hypothetical protein